MRLCLSSFRVGAAHVVGPALQRTGSRGPFDGDHHFVILPWCYHQVIQSQSMYHHIYIYNIHTLSWCVPFSIAIVEVFFSMNLPIGGTPIFPPAGGGWGVAPLGEAEAFQQCLAEPQGWPQFSGRPPFNEAVVDIDIWYICYQIPPNQHK